MSAFNENTLDLVDYMLIIDRFDLDRDGLISYDEVSIILFLLFLNLYFSSNI